MRVGWVVAGAMLAVLVGAGPVAAKSFRWASDADVFSLDPYARHETFLHSFLDNIYEPLVRRGRDLRLEPALAVSWIQRTPEIWRFTLRQGVRFQDGSPFTADDVVFSFARLRSPTSQLAAALANLREVDKVDDHTVDIVTGGPDPILPDEIAEWDIMSKSWCLKHQATQPDDPAQGEEGYAARHADGTGPFRIATREPEVKTVLVPNPEWWDKPIPDLDQVVFRPIPDANARVAALVSGAVDMIYAVPPAAIDRIAQTPGLHLVQGPELRTLFLGFDQARDALMESNIKGRNPYKDRRVRQAFYQAIDETAITRTVMRGFATPAGLMVAPGITGFEASLNQRLPYDPAAARRLLAEAGYPQGFETGMDCPTDRYVNDAAICQSVVSMLSQVGIKVKLLAQPRAQFFAKILSWGGPYTSFYLYGWAPANDDALNMLINLTATRDMAAHRGDFNFGGYSNAKLDALIARIETETDQKKRLDLLHQALALVKDDIAYIPLHQQQLVWAARDGVELVQRSDDSFPLRYVRMN